MWWAGHVARMEKSRTAFKILTEKPIEKRHLEGRRYIYIYIYIYIRKDNVITDTKEIDVYNTIGRIGMF